MHQIWAAAAISTATCVNQARATRLPIWTAVAAGIRQRACVYPEQGGVLETGDFTSPSSNQGRNLGSSFRSRFHSWPIFRADGISPASLGPIFWRIIWQNAANHFGSAQVSGSGDPGGVRRSERRRTGRRPGAKPWAQRINPRGDATLCTARVGAGIAMPARNAVIAQVIRRAAWAERDGARRAQLAYDHRNPRERP